MSGIHEKEPGPGARGSGGVFFSGCNMRCIFCQNSDISARQKGELCDSERLSSLFLGLQAQGAYNINLVTPTPHITALQQAIPLARARGLTIPIVYNTNAYESVEALRCLEGLIDIYLPDLKYVSPALSARFSDTPDYFAHAAHAILEMQRQVGSLQLGQDGLGLRGLILRHLALPGCPDDTRRVLDFAAESLPLHTQLSLMRQYTPCAPGLPPPLNRRLTEREYARAVQYCLDKGLERVWIQGEESAQNFYTPPFFSRLTNS